MFLFRKCSWRNHNSIRQSVFLGEMKWQADVTCKQIRSNLLDPLQTVKVVSADETISRNVSLCYKNELNHTHKSIFLFLVPVHVPQAYFGLIPCENCKIYIHFEITQVLAYLWPLHVILFDTFFCIRQLFHLNFARKNMLHVANINS